MKDYIQSHPWKLGQPLLLNAVISPLGTKRTSTIGNATKHPWKLKEQVLLQNTTISPIGTKRTNTVMKYYNFLSH